MSVYFIRSNDLIKIGFSNDVKRRVGTVINGQREGGEFLGCMPGDRSLEAHFHSMFAEHREYGEWFRSNDRLLALIADLTSTTFPESEKRKPQDRLLLQEERHSEEAADYIRRALEGLPRDAQTFDAISASTSIPADRLRAIYEGAACPITAGEYVVLRMVHDAFLGLTPDDYRDAEEEGRRWAENRIAQKQMKSEAA